LPKGGEPVLKLKGTGDIPVRSDFLPFREKLPALLQPLKVGDKVRIFGQVSMSYDAPKEIRIKPGLLTRKSK
jgi:hypothetical protein